MFAGALMLVYSLLHPPITWGVFQHYWDDETEELCREMRNLLLRGQMPKAFKATAGRLSLTD